MDLDRSARVWGAIQAVAADEGTPTSLRHAVTACAQRLSAIGAGFGMTHDRGTWEPLLACAAEAGELDELQYTLGEGPSCDAIRRGAPVLESDLAGLDAGQRWPAFTVACTELGVRAAFAFPIGVGAARVGVLSVYRRPPGPLRPDEVQDALVFADAMLVLALDHRRGVGADLNEVIEAAFNARRAEVHQAAGVVAAQQGISVANALARLRAHAYSSGLSLQRVAAEVMAGRLRLEIDTKTTATPHSKETGSKHAEMEQEEDS